jgi:hypothetical protein
VTGNDLAARLGAKRAGKGWTARCPAHEDDRASLSIGTGQDGRALVKCHTGCRTEDVLTALGLTLADLYEHSTEQSSRSRIIATYDYRDEGGALLYQVVRFEPKTFRQRRPDGSGWTWRLGDVRRVAYRLPELRGRATVFAPEGERDVDRLWALGLPATCNAGGAGKWQDAYTRQLVAAGVQHVVILPDNDAPGRQHGAMVARSCLAAGLAVKLVELPGLPDHGDVSDWLAAGHTRDDLAALVTAAPRYTPDPADDPLDLVTLADVQPERVEWLWPRRLARRKYSLLAGDPGLGKSTLALGIAARLSRPSSTWPDGSPAPHGRTLVLSAEDGIADTIRPRIDRLEGDASQIVVLRAVRDERGARPLNVARDLDRLAEAIRRVQPLLVLIDPITAYLGRTDSYKDAEVRGLLAPLMAEIDAQRVALLAVGHLAKADQRAALHRPGGSIAFVAAARIVLCLAADPNDPDRRVLAGLKSNLAALPESLAFRLPDGRLTWEHGAVELDAEALLRPAAPADREDATDADAVLRALLADVSAWPMDAKQALAAGEAHGITERTLRRAARRLGVEIRRVGFGRGGRWYWYLPETEGIPDARIPDNEPSLNSVSPMAPMSPMGPIEEKHTHRGHDHLHKGSVRNADGGRRVTTAASDPPAFNPKGWLS